MVLQNQDTLVTCDDRGLSSEHFGIEGNKYIYLAIMYLYQQKQRPNAVNIMEILPDSNSRKSVEDVGGSAYITSLLGMQKLDDNPKIYIDKILQAYTRRKILKVCEDVSEEIKNDKANVLNQSELLDLLQKEVSSMTSDIVSNAEVYKIGDDTDKVLAERSETPNSVPGLETGWRKFDKLTNGGQPGDLIFVAARSKTGKSVTLVNWAIQMGIIDKMPILYID